jgi:hypothetical protein
MNKYFVFVAAIAVAFVVNAGQAAQKILLSEARAQYESVISAPEAAAKLIASLSSEDQLVAIAELNKAISKMRAIPEEKSAIFAKVNRAAVLGASKGNKLNIVAEVFATVPPYALTIINERFAAELFDRAAAGSVYTDAQFEALASKAMSTIVKRCEKEDDASVRQTFAAIMFVRASGGTPSDLASKLVAQLPDAKVRDIALNEWVKSATNEPKSYEPMLGASDFEGNFKFSMVSPLCGDVMINSILLELDPAERAHAYDEGVGLPLRSTSSGLSRVPIGYPFQRP